MKIKRLDLQDFMLFHKINLSFSPNINIICGENSTGKTALIKLLYSCAKCCETLKNTKGDITKERIDNELVSKLQGVFRPDKDSIGRLVYRRQGSGRADITVRFDEDALFQVCENTDDKRLLWLDTWDGTTSYELPSLHPLFIEVSRRVRAINKNGKLFFKKAPSACPRIDIGKTCGNLGDPWEPIVSDAKGLRVFSSSLDYANIAKIITGEETIMPNLLNERTALLELSQ